MFTYSYDDLDREQLETFIDAILYPLDSDIIHTPAKRYKATNDPNTDEMLEVLIDWVEWAKYAFELMEGRKEKANIFLLEDNPETAWKAKKTIFNVAALENLRMILDDLRRCESNSIIQRSLGNEKKGRPKDTHRIKRLKNEVGRIYNYLRSKDVASDDACEAINAALHQWKLPLMSKDSIRKKASKNKASPMNIIDGEEGDFENDIDGSSGGIDLTDIESSKHLQIFMSVLLLMQFAKDAQFSL